MYNVHRLQRLTKAYVYYKKAAYRNHLLAQGSAVYYQVRWRCDLVDCAYFCEKLVQSGKVDNHIRFLYARLLDNGTHIQKDKKKYTFLGKKRKKSAKNLAE